MSDETDESATPSRAGIGYPLVYMSAVMLQLFTAWTAYRMVDPGEWRLPAAIAAFAFPPVSTTVVGYHAWRQSGSMVNSYSVWVLIWIVLFLIVVGLGRMRDRRHPGK